MILKGLLTATVLSAGILLSAHFVFDQTETYASNEENLTLSLAPISLGNSAAAAALTTRSPAGIPDDITPSQAPAYEVSVKVGQGDTLSALLNRAGISRKDGAGAIRALKKIFKPSRLRHGQEISIAFQADPEALTDTKNASSGDFLRLSLATGCGSLTRFLLN